MSPTIAECLEHARQCEWYAARTNDEGDRKFLLWRAKEWTKLAVEKEQVAAAMTAAYTERRLSADKELGMRRSHVVDKMSGNDSGTSAVLPVCSFVTSGREIT
jgi:hypothetical protein